MRFRNTLRQFQESFKDCKKKVQFEVGNKKYKSHKKITKEWALNLSLLVTKTLTYSMLRLN